MPFPRIPRVPGPRRCWPPLLLALVATGLGAAPPRPDTAPPTPPAPLSPAAASLAEQLREAVRLTEAQQARRSPGVSQRFALVHPTAPEGPGGSARPVLSRLRPSGPRATTQAPPPDRVAQRGPGTPGRAEGLAHPANRAGMEVGPQSPAIGALQRPRRAPPPEPSSP